jgi:hypothetical protein
MALVLFATCRHRFADELEITPAGSTVDCAARETDTCGATVLRVQATSAEPQHKTTIELKAARIGSPSLKGIFKPLTE